MSTSLTRSATVDFPPFVEESGAPTSSVLGVDCFVGDLGTAADAIVRRALAGEGGHACLANVHVVVSARRDSALRESLDRAWAVFADGAPIAWAQRRSGFHARRIAGPDLMLAVLDRGRAFGLRHALFGSTPDVVASLESNLRRRFPGVDLVAALAPAPGGEDIAESVGAIASAQPHVAWVALGAPKQELWAARNAAALAPALVLGVGAAFEFHAGWKKRAPSWMQQAGLEWLHRLAHEPRRLGWRYLSTNTLFTLAILKGAISRDRR
jgi:N-acetylglucosaminyldiphosphoundecaprenol N-acetyl-beta-D-mannosaminyltransferase